MAKSSAKRKVAFISSFLPRKCGIATFVSDLINNTSVAAKGNFEPLVVAMRAENNLKYDDPVKEIDEQDKFLPGFVQLCKFFHRYRIPFHFLNTVKSPAEFAGIPVNYLNRNDIE